MTATRTAAAGVGHPSTHTSGAAPLPAGRRAEVGHRVAALSRPGIATRRDLLDWLHGLDPHRFGRVARLVLDGPPREPARHVTAPTLGETVADAIDLYGAAGVRHG